jgi:hypothetical protein
MSLNATSTPIFVSPSTPTQLDADKTGTGSGSVKSAPLPTGNDNLPKFPLRRADRERALNQNRPDAANQNKRQIATGTSIPPDIASYESSFLAGLTKSASNPVPTGTETPAWVSSYESSFLADLTKSLSNPVPTGTDVPAWVSSYESSFMNGVTQGVSIPVQSGTPTTMSTATSAAAVSNQPTSTPANSGGSNLQGQFGLAAIAAYLLAHNVANRVLR